MIAESRNDVVPGGKAWAASAVPGAVAERGDVFFRCSGRLKVGPARPCLPGSSFKSHTHHLMVSIWQLQLQTSVTL